MMQRLQVLCGAMVALAGFFLLTALSEAQQQTLIPPLSAVSATTSASYNWSGYVATGGEYTAVSGSWMVPEVSPVGGFSAEATWVGIGGVATEDLIQTGTQSLVDARGNTHYESWYELLPDASVPMPLDVAPGDTVSASVELEEGTRWRISMTNHTTGAYYSHTVRYDSSRSSAQWVEEMPSLSLNGAFIPLADFGSVHFTDARATQDGVSKTITGLPVRPIAMANAVGEWLALPSIIVEDDLGFSVWRTDAAIVQARPDIRGQYLLIDTAQPSR